MRWRARRLTRSKTSMSTRVSSSRISKSAIRVFEHVAEHLCVFFGIRVESSDRFERDDAWGGLLQQINKRGYRGSFVRLMGQRRPYYFPKPIRKTELFPLWRSGGSLPIYDPFRYNRQRLILWERYLSGEQLREDTRGASKS